MAHPGMLKTLVRKMNLSTKLLLLLSCITAAVLSAFSFHDYLQTQRTQLAELDLFAERFSQKLSRSLEQPLATRQYAQAKQILRTALQDKRIQCAALHFSHEHIQDFGFALHDGRTTPASLCSDNGSVRNTSVTITGEQPARLSVACRTEHIDQALHAIVTDTIVKLLILIPALCLGLYAALRRLVFVPLNRLTNTTQKVIDTQIFTARTPITNEDELGRLTRRINMMLDEIETRDHQLQSRSQVLQEEISVRSTELADKNAALEAANKRFMELDELKSGFLSTVSHDLRTPLTSILGFSKLINQDFCKLFLPFAGNDKKLLKRGERIKHNLRIIQHEGERLTRLINDFLDLSRIESGKMQWRDTDLSIRGLAKHAVEAVQGQLDLKPGLAMRLEIQDDLPLLYCDEDRIMQVLVNLLNNAVKFTSSGHVLLRAGMRHEKLRIEVQDTGPGIPQDQLVKIFDKFHKVEEAEQQREKKPAGTGLGLAICRETIQHYNGRIWAESEPGKGSAFIIELPGFQRTPHAPRVVQPLPARDKTRILVVDDNAFIREYFNQLLSDAAYEVYQAKSGEEALEKARDTIPDLIIMDLLMPGMGGEMAVRHFRSDPELACVPILIISISQDALDYSGDARMEKPVDPDRFMEVVNGLLRKRRSKSPVLIVDHPDCLPTDLIFDSKAVSYIEAKAVAEEIASGFRGTVVLSRSTLHRLSLNLQDQPAGVNFLIVGCA